ETVDIVQKDQRDAVLIAIEDEARRLLGRFGIDDTAEFDALLIRAASQRLNVFFLIRDDADGPSTDAGVATEQRLAIFGAVFFKLASVDDARDDFAHVVLLAGVVGEGAVDFARGI